MLRRLLPLLLLPTVACADRGSPTGPSADLTPGCPDGGLQLAVGDALLVTGPDAARFCVGGGGSGAEYVLVPFFASETGTATLGVEAVGRGVVPVAGPPNPAFGPGPAREQAAIDPYVPDYAFHWALRRREMRELAPPVTTASAPPTARSAVAPAPARALGVPRTGEILELNVAAQCDSSSVRSGRVMAVSATAVVLADTENPPGGFGQQDWEFFATTMDTLVYPVDVAHFGEPSDIDQNGRVILFFTRAVNALTEPHSDSYIGGFFWAGDLFPRESTSRLQACPASNNGEVFYLLVPDPTGAVNQNVRSTDFVRRTTIGTIAHEFEHLINASRRLHVNRSGSFEEVWLNEGLAHIAEELLFYATTPFAPGQNLSLEDLRRSEQVRAFFNAYAASNFGRFRQYLRDPEGETLMGVDNLPTRGASWAFLRYAADRHDGPDAALFKRLVNGPKVGLANLQEALGTDPVAWIQAWTVSVYTDDAVPSVGPELMQPSWNFRSVMQAFSGVPGEFPLRVEMLGEGVERRISLKGGGAAYLRFGVAPSGSAEVALTSGGARPPEGLRVSLVRTR